MSMLRSYPWIRPAIPEVSAAQAPQAAESRHFLKIFNENKKLLSFLQQA
jgi:hypothetical protein